MTANSVQIVLLVFEVSPFKIDKIDFIRVKYFVITADFCPALPGLVTVGDERLDRNTVNKWLGV